MIKYVGADSLPVTSWLHRYCLVNPDVLLQLTDRFAQARSDSREQLADQFSRLLDDMRIGGTWKRTARGRLRETERVLGSYLQPEPGAPTYWLDLGGSDGITTLEATRKLRQRSGENVQAYLADFYIWLQRYRCGPVIEYRANDGEPIMMRVGRFGLRLAKHRHELHHAVEALARLYLTFGGLRRRMALTTSISLINPLVAAEPAITVLEMNCLVRDNRLRNRLAAIRASNVLNFSYFTAAQIVTVISHLHAYLREGACLIVSRNDGPMTSERERGSVWTRHRCGFRHCEDFGGGSEVSELVDSWRRPAS